MYKSGADCCNPWYDGFRVVIVKHAELEMHCFYFSRGISVFEGWVVFFVRFWTLDVSRRFVHSALLML